jgi:hypothetical protein
MTARIDLSTFNVIRRSYIKDKHFNPGELALQLHIDRDTVGRYVKECQVIEMLYPKRLPDMHFRIPVPEQVRPPTDRHKDMILNIKHQLKHHNSPRQGEGAGCESVCR